MTQLLTDDIVIEERIKPGGRVEVRSRYDGSWSHGFEVAEVTPEGYRLKRLSDLSVLPIDFRPHDVRRDADERERI